MEFLIDPGTYAYHTQSRWRQYFRGTAGHNCLRVDGVDQSQSGGNFMWIRKASARCSRWRPSAESDLFEGWHDGYLRLPDPVLHRRRVLLEKRPRRVVIEDTLQMSGVHEIELFFHCSDRCRVDPSDEGYLLGQGSRTLVLKLPKDPATASRVYFGNFAPISGWVSNRFDDKQPAPTIAWKARLSGNTLLRSEIMC
jgi:hypothetical protein